MEKGNFKCSQSHLKTISLKIPYKKIKTHIANNSPLQ